MWVARHWKELRVTTRFVVWAMAYIGWGRKAEDNEFGCENIAFEFQSLSFRSPLKVGNRTGVQLN